MTALNAPSLKGSLSTIFLVPWGNNIIGILLWIAWLDCSYKSLTEVIFYFSDDFDVDVDLSRLRWIKMWPKTSHFPSLKPLLGVPFRFGFFFVDCSLLRLIRGRVSSVSTSSIGIPLWSRAPNSKPRSVNLSMIWLMLFSCRWRLEWRRRGEGWRTLNKIFYCKIDKARTIKN